MFKKILMPVMVTGVAVGLGQCNGAKAVLVELL